MVEDGDDLMIVSSGGVVIRLHVADIPVVHRNTQGVRLIRMAEGEEVATVTRVELDQDKDGDA